MVDIARLIVELIGVVVWPTVVLVGLFQYRSPLTAILNRLKSAGLPGGVSLDFDQDVLTAQELSRDVAQAPAKEAERSTPMLPVTEANARMLTLGMQPSPSGLILSRYIELAQQDPNLALAGLRMEIEILVRNLAKGFKVDIQSRDSASIVLRKLYEADAITVEQYKLAQTIVRLCNAAVHGTRVSLQEAEAVVGASETLANDYLEWLSWGFDDGWEPSCQGQG